MVRSLYGVNTQVQINLKSLEFEKEDSLMSHVAQALFHIEISPCELWHRRFGPLHFKIFPTLGSIVDGIPNLKEDNEGVCKGCALGKNTKTPFGSSA